MNVLDKLPLIGSSLAFAGSIALPFVFNNESTQVVQASEVNVVTKTFSRKEKPRLPWQRLQEANKYLDCVDEQDKTKEECRKNFWYWDV